MKGRAADQLHALRTHYATMTLYWGPVRYTGSAWRRTLAWLTGEALAAPELNPSEYCRPGKISGSNPLLSDSDMSEWYLKFTRGCGVTKVFPRPILIICL